MAHRRPRCVAVHVHVDVEPKVAALQIPVEYVVWVGEDMHTTEALEDIAEAKQFRPTYDMVVAAALVVARHSLVLSYSRSCRDHRRHPLAMVHRFHFLGCLVVALQLVQG